MDMTNEEVLKLVEKAKKNRQKLTHLTNKKDLGIDERFKISLCKHFVQFAVEKRMTMTELSKLTRIPNSRLSEITNYKVTLFKIDQLLKYLGTLAEHSPRVREYLNYLGYAVEVRDLTVKDTKRLVKGIKDVSEHGSESVFLQAYP